MALKPKVGPAGSQTSSNPAIILNNMVSLPTLTSYTSYWTFTAIKTGYVIFDVCLSMTANNEQTAAQPAVGISVSGANAVRNLPFDEFGEPSSRASVLYAVDKGVTYQVAAQPYTGLTNMVLRVSDYSTERSGAIPNLTFSDASLNFDYKDKLHHDLLPPRGGSIAIPYGQDIDGHYNVQKTLLGPASASQYDAIECAWRWSRQVAGDAFGSFFWGAEPGPNYPYWNPSYAICPVVTGWPWGGAPNGGGGTIGYSYNGNGDSSFGLGYGDAEFYISHLSRGIRIDNAREGLKNEHLYWITDMFGDPVAYGSGLNGTGYECTFGTNKVPGNVVGMATCSDQFDGGGPEAKSYGDLGAVFFMAIAEGIAGSGSTFDYTESNWRAVNYPVGGAGTNRYWPGGLEASRAAKSFYSRTLRADEIMPWVEVPAARLAEAKAAEQTSGYGLWVALIPEGTKSNDPQIPTGDALAAQNGTDPSWHKNDQVLLVRFTAEYPDYHLIDYPAYPDSTSLGIGGGPGDAERYFVGRS